MDMVLLFEALKVVVFTLGLVALLFGSIFLQFEKGNKFTGAILIMIGFIGMVGLVYLQMLWDC